MRYLVGIDLGTTNSALAYIDLQNRPQGRQPRAEDLSDAATRRRRPGGRAAAAAVVPVPARPARSAARLGRPAVGSERDLRRRRVRPQPRGQGPRPAGVVRQVVALPRRRRSHRAAAAVDRAAGRAATVAARSLDALPAAHGPGLEPRAEPRRGRSAGEPDGRPDGAGVVRRRGPQPDRRGREGGGAQERHAARRAAGRVLLLARPERPARSHARCRRACAAWSSTSAAAPATSA